MVFVRRSVVARRIEPGTVLLLLLPGTVVPYLPWYADNRIARIAFGGPSDGPVSREGHVELTDDTVCGGLLRQVGPPPVDFSWNTHYEPEFLWYDQSLVDAARTAMADGTENTVLTFFQLLALCHTVMPSRKNGKNNYAIIIVTTREPFSSSYSPPHFPAHFRARPLSTST